MSEPRTQGAKAGIKLPDDMREEFEDLAVDNGALQAKYINFCAAIHLEQRQLVIRSREVWAEVMFKLGLQGEWKYEDGKVYPIDETPAK